MLVDVDIASPARRLKCNRARPSRWNRLSDLWVRKTFSQDVRNCGPADACYLFMSAFGLGGMDWCLLRVSERPIASNSLTSLASRAALTFLTS